MNGVKREKSAVREIMWYGVAFWYKLYNELASII